MTVRIRRSRRIPLAIALVAMFMPFTTAHADTEITYQGELTQNGALADGAFDMSFALWDSLAGGAQIGSTISLRGVQVTEGRFAVELDFGADAFDNSARWLEIMVGANTLTPRQPITRTPYAIQTRGIQVDENEHIGMGVIPGGQRLRVWNLEGPGFQSISSGRAVEALSSDADIAMLASNQAEDGIGAFGQNTVSGNWGYLGSELYGVLGRATDVETEWAGYFEGRGYFSNYTLIGRQERITPSEFFGVRSPNNNGYGGMYVDTLGADAWPYYGYATNGESRAWHYYNGSTGIWHVNNNGNRLNVHSDGRVGIGTQNFIDARLDVRTGAGVGVRGATSDANSFDFLAAGAGTNYGSSSSRRWKSDIVPIENPLDAIGRLRGVRYTWDAEHGGHRDVGMIAEEVGVVLPEIVSYEDNGIDAIAMDYSKLTPLLVEAVKALRTEHAAELANAKAEIAKATTEIESLRDENDVLRQRLADVEALVEQALRARVGATDATP